MPPVSPLFRAGAFVVAAGPVIAFAAETAADPAKIDHFWITLDAGGAGRVRVAISTVSRINRHAGFDERVSVAVLPATWTALPERGITQCARFDYADLAAHPDYHFITYDRVSLEQLLTAKARRAIFAEAWGEFYLRNHLGLHQVHSRRASCSVLRDVVGRDGALRFYFEKEHATEMLLFKFCGQL